MLCHVSFSSLYLFSTFSDPFVVDVLCWQLVQSVPPCHLGLYHNDHQHQSSVIMWSTGTLTLPHWGPGENWVWAPPAPPAPPLVPLVPLVPVGPALDCRPGRVAGTHSDLPPGTTMQRMSDWGMNVLPSQPASHSLGLSQLISQDVPSPHLTSHHPHSPSITEDEATYGGLSSSSSTSNVTI